MPTVLRRMRRQEIYVSAGAWTPASLPNLVGWWDASDTSSITASGGAVSQWNDKSSSGAHAVQATGSAQPTTGTRTINSLNVIDFDGSADYLSFTNPCSAASAGTALYVFAGDADPGVGLPGAPIASFGSSSSGTHMPYSDGNCYDTFGSTSQKNTGNPSATLTNPRQWSVVSAASDWRAYLDGASWYSTGTNTVGWASTAGFGTAKVGDVFRYDGRVAEVIVCSSALNTTDRQTAEAYLKAKWGTP